MSALATIALGALAQQAGVDAATIRAYERLGLIHKPRRAAGGLQLYRTDDVARVTFIRRTQELGFSIPAIRELLEITDKSSGTCGDVHDLAQRHLLDIRRRREDLARLETMLAPLVSACPRKGSIEHCPIVNALSHPA
ncbi:MAG: MerR family DNA-binding protein [Reyranella sp.]|nr:MerR family DNA-binding protein [Reyranella sp.]